MYKNLMETVGNVINVITACCFDISFVQSLAYISDGFTRLNSEPRVAGYDGCRDADPK